MPAGNACTNLRRLKKYIYIYKKKLSVSIIGVGFVSGIHYRLIGLIRKRHDGITNSTWACQDGASWVFQSCSLDETPPPKHLVISVWRNNCAQPFIDLRCKSSRLPICNNKWPSAARAERDGGKKKEREKKKKKGILLAPNRFAWRRNRKKPSFANVF